MATVRLGRQMGPVKCMLALVVRGESGIRSSPTSITDDGDGDAVRDIESLEPEA